MEVRGVISIVASIATLIVIDTLSENVRAPGVWSSASIVVGLILAILIISIINEYVRAPKIYASVVVILAAIMVIMSFRAVYFAAIYLVDWLGTIYV